MRPGLTLIVILTLALAASTTAHAQSWQPPTEEERCPSKWGQGDERGSGNHMNAQTVLRAAQLIRTGEVFELGYVLSRELPFFGDRRFDVHIKRTRIDPYSNPRGSNEELVITELGQVGTQFDGFPHQTIGDTFYNCVPAEEIATRTGFTKLGVEKVGMLMTRGVLINVAAAKGVDMLPDSAEITAEDLQEALARQNLQLQPGDAVIINTGWGHLWGVDNDRYRATAPGIGISAGEWLVTQDPMLVGSDNWSVEVNPNPDPTIRSPVHQILLVANGIYLIEKLKLDELVAARAYEFAFIVQPLKIKGGTGSTIAPVAIR